MAIKVEIIGSEALQRQIEVLKFYPEIVDAKFYPALKEIAEVVKANIRPNLPEHTGRLGRALGSKVIHSKTSALGTRADIGFGKRYGQPSAPYAAALNEGAEAHTVTGRRREDRLLHFSSKGQFTAIGSIEHPGFSGWHFMEAGLETSQMDIDRIGSMAAEQVIQELAKS